MKVIVNSLLMNSHFSGVQYYMEHLLNALDNSEHHPLSIEALLSKSYTGKLTKSARLRLAYPVDTVSRTKRVLWENMVLPFRLRKEKEIVYHSLAYVLPLICPCKSIVTIHDLIALQYPGLCQKESAAYFGYMLPRTITRANKIIAVSQKVKSDILNSFDIDPEKVSVIYHGVDPAFKKVTDNTLLEETRREYRLPGKFILFVGNLEPKKNIYRILEAFAILKKSRAIEHSMVFAGKKGWKMNDLDRAIAAHGLEECVHITGYVEKAHLPALYSLADVFVFPSLYEGFGLPVVEAMACGTPALISNAGALPEIGGDACVQADPYDVSSIAEAMYSLLSDAPLRERCAREGLSRAGLFSWEKTAQETMKVYQSLI